MSVCWVTEAQLVVPYELYEAALCLDGPTLANLELLEGSGGQAEGSLLAALDTCASPGKKVLENAGKPCFCHYFLCCELMVFPVYAARPVLVDYTSRYMHRIGPVILLCVCGLEQSACQIEETVCNASVEFLFGLHQRTTPLPLSSSAVPNTVCLWLYCIKQADVKHEC